MDTVQSIAEIPFIAGNTALDFVNTAEMRGHPAAGDALMTTDDLRVWGRRYGLITRSTADAGDEGELERAREAREVLYALFVARAHGHGPPKRMLARLAELGADAYRAATLEVTADGTVHWRWSRSRLSTIRHVAVTSAIDLLHADPSPRLKQCPGDHCGWLFLDLTKRGNRRWCSMGECGQEAKNLKRRKPPGAHRTTSS